jgi:ankyrin repeat protein
MVNIHKIGMEDIMISLGGKLGLTKQQLFEYIKVTASQQSNPPQAVLDIMAEINRLITFRPTQWVVNDLNVLETEEVRRKNDRFVMHAASGKLAEFQEMVENGQELTCLHSELRYTALHAAADFGQTAIVDYIITTGVSLDMKDPRKQQTALHIAAYNNRIGVIKSLLAANADRTLGDMHGTKPYMYADMQGLTDAREMLKYLPPTVIDLVVSGLLFIASP